MMCNCFSSLTKKYLMAITGLLLIGFVLAHMLGNLQIFLGADAINAYAQTLKDMGPLLWVARIGLLVVFLLHLKLAFNLKCQNKSARPTAYQNPSTIQASAPSLSMIATGTMILLFLIYHLCHYTLFCIHPEFSTLIDHLGRHDVYRMVVFGFSNFWVSLIYIVAMIFLCLHIFHGASSVFQSLGLNTPKWHPYTRLVGPALALVILIGNCSIPVAILLGCIQ